MCQTSGGSPVRYVLTRHGRYLRVVTAWPTEGTKSATVGVVDTESLSAAMRICTKKAAGRLAYLVNQHEHLPHMRWQVVPG